jgi:chromosomal replication initiator protein
MINKKDVWKKITTTLESELPRSESKTWFSHTSLRKLDMDNAVIKVPNKFIANWLRDNYLTKIRHSFKKTLGFLPTIQFVYTIPSHKEDMDVYHKSSESEKAFEHNVNPSLTFSNFITAPSNQFAFESALAVAEDPARKYNPLYMFSKLSIGKTHILNAIGNHILKKNPAANVKYITADEFSDNFNFASKLKRFDEFRQPYKYIDILLLDDIHLFGERKKAQQELTTLFSLFHESNRQIAVSGQASPSDIHNLLPQLRSRMEGGLLFEIHGPDQETLTRIIKQKAEENSFDLPDDVAFFLTKTTKDLKTLIQYLVSIQSHVSLYQRKIDMSTVKSIIKIKHLANANVQDIQKFTAQYFDISLSDLLSNKKTRKLSYPRHIAMYLSRKLTNLSYKEIGKAFGNKHHATVIHAVNLIDEYKDLKISVFQDINKLHNYFFQS